MKMTNLESTRATEGVASVLQDAVDDAVDPHLERIKNEAVGGDGDEEDEDFVADKDGGGSSTDDSGDVESDASKSGEEKEAPLKKKHKKEPSAPKASSSKKKTKDGEDDGSKKKKKQKKKKKKDPNAPKRAISAFMFFSQTERENVKKSNPGISFTDVGKVLGERWKNKMSADDKAPYEVKARADKKRYTGEISDYKNPRTSNLDLADVSGKAN